MKKNPHAGTRETRTHPGNHYRTLLKWQRKTPPPAGRTNVRELQILRRIKNC